MKANCVVLAKHRGAERIGISPLAFVTGSGDCETMRSQPMKTIVSNCLAALVLLAGIGAAVADEVVLAPEQETTIREYVKKEPLASVKLPGVELNVGSKLSEKVELHEVPNVKYRYTVIDNRTVVVDPETHTIIKVLD